MMFSGMMFGGMMFSGMMFKRFHEPLQCTVHRLDDGTASAADVNSSTTSGPRDEAARTARC